MAVFVCGLPSALDATAGERERGSLEPLLLSPVSRASIAVGKWLAASLMAILGAGLTLLVAQAALRLPSLAELPFGLGGLDMMRVIVALIPLALLASALQALIGLQSGTFKEAQAQGNLLILVPMVPGFLVAFGAAVPPIAAKIPVIGHQLLIEQVLKGGTPRFGETIALSIETLLLSALFIAVMARQLDRDAKRLA
jgi:sodium transport system permease protein